MSDVSTRLYSVSDRKMLGKAAIIVSLLETNFPLFQEYAPHVFVEDYLLIFKDEVEQGRALYGDGQVRMELAKQTQEVNDSKKKFKKALSKLQFNAEGALGKNNPNLRSFGIGSISKNCGEVDRLILFATQMDTVITTFKTELLDFGCPPSVFTDFEKAAKDLVKKHSDQQMFKLHRMENTIQRIGRLNSIWTRMAEISRGAKGVFADTPRLAERYALPYPEKGDAEDPTDHDELLK